MMNQASPAPHAIRSYLVYPEPGRRDEVVQVLTTLGCDVYPADNRDVIVIVADHQGRDAQRSFDQHLETVPGVVSVAFVSGHTE